MFEREIKFIYDFNLNKVNKLGPYFTFEQLLSSNINPAIQHYISSEIDYLIFEDRQKLLKNSVFDYSGEKISQLFSQIGDEVKRTKRFSIEYVSKLILHASSFTINFLVRPKWTLVKFVFDEGEHKTTSEIKQILNYLYFYKHLKSILISYINTKKIISMNSEEFSSLLNKVDNLGVETYLNSILSGSLKSMAEFFNIGEVQKNKIPLIAVQTFLEEKQLIKHVEKIHSTFGEDLNAKFNISEYQKIFDSIIPEKEEFIAEEGSGDLFEPVIVEQHDIDDEPSTLPVDELKSTEQIENVEENIIKESEDSSVTEIENHEEPKDFKPKKIRIKIKENNEIEKIETLEPENSDEKIEIKESEEDESDSFFANFQEDVVEDIPEEPPAPVTFIDEEEIEENKEPKEEELKNVEVEEEDEFDKAAEKVGMMLDYKKSNYDEFINENDEIKDIYEEADKTLQEIENKLNVNADEEKEKTVQKILNNKSDFEETDDDNYVRPNKKQGTANPESRKADLTELLEHKDMTKIIESIFDYDIEEFSNTLEDILDCENVKDAIETINKTIKQHGINRKSKEAELFKHIISDYFNRI